MVVLEAIPLVPNGAIVGGENNQGILCDSVFVQCLKHLSDAVIHLLGKIAVDTDWTGVLEFLGGHPGSVGRRQGEV